MKNLKKMLMFLFLVLITMGEAHAFENIAIPDITGVWKVEIDETNVSCGQEKSGLERYNWEIAFTQRGHTIWAKLVGGDAVNDAANGYTFSGVVKDNKVYLFGTGGPDCAYNSFVDGILSKKNDVISGEFIGGDCFCNDSGIYRASKMRSNQQ